MPSNILVDMKRVKGIDEKSKKIINSYKKNVERTIRPGTFVLDLSNLKMGGRLAKCKCQCSSTSDCGGGGGGH